LNDSPRLEVTRLLQPQHGAGFGPNKRRMIYICSLQQLREASTPSDNWHMQDAELRVTGVALRSTTTQRNG